MFDFYRQALLSCHGCHHRLYYLVKTLTFMVQRYGMMDTTSALSILTMVGFREHTQKDSGVVFSLGPFTEPPGFSLSYTVTT